MEQEFTFGTFRLEKQDYSSCQMFRCSRRKFSLERPKKSPIPFTLQPDFPEIFLLKKTEITD